MTQHAPHVAALAGMLAPADSRPRTAGTWLLLNLAVLAVYSAAGLIVLWLGIGPAKISPIYPPAGIAIAATLILGPRILPAVFLGQFLNGFPLLESPGITVFSYVLANTGTGIGSVLEALIALAVMRAGTGGWHPFERPRHVVVFLLGSALGAAFVCSVIGTASLWALGFVPKGEVEITLITFVLADAAGIAIFASLILAWYREPQIDRRIVIHAAIILGTIALIAGVEAWTRYRVDYLFLPLLIWAGFTVGPRGVTLTAAAVIVIATLATVSGIGDFVGKTSNESILLLEGFTSVIAFTGLMLVAVRSQQLEAEAALEAHNRMLEQRVAERTAEVVEKNQQLEEKQARIDDDLHVTQLLQASILPKDFSSYSSTDIAASMKPALEVGGDFYDVFPIAGGRLALVVADVSGKGVAAAFFMAVTRTMLRGIACQGSAPAQCVAQVNEALCRENPLDMFVTTFYAELSETSGHMRFINAGHCEPILIDANGQARLIKHTGNPPLGVMPGSKFAESDVALAPGDMLFLYTDGLTESFNAQGEAFRVQRLVDAAVKLAGAPPNDLMMAVLGDLEQFSAGTVQSDDMTCLVIRRKP